MTTTKPMDIKSFKRLLRDMIIAVQYMERHVKANTNLAQDISAYTEMLGTIKYLRTSIAEYECFIRERLQIAKKNSPKRRKKSGKAKRPKSSGQTVAELEAEVEAIRNAR